VKKVGSPGAANFTGPGGNLVAISIRKRGKTRAAWVLMNEKRAGKRREDNSRYLSQGLGARNRAIHSPRRRRTICGKKKDRQEVRGKKEERLQLDGSTPGEESRNSTSTKLGSECFTKGLQMNSRAPSERNNPGRGTWKEKAKKKALEEKGNEKKAASLEERSDGDRPMGPAVTTRQTQSKKDSVKKKD